MATKKLSAGHKILAIDFGSYSIKLVTGKVSKDGIHILQSITMPIPPEVYNNGEILNAKELGVLLKQVLKDKPYKGLPVVCTINGQNCVLRVLSLPLVKGSDLTEMVNYEVRQYLPVDVSQYVIQYSILGETDKGDTKEIQLLVGAVPRSFAENLYQMFLDIEVHPHALDLQVHGISKLFSYLVTQPQYAELKGKNVMLVDLGHTQMDIGVYEEGAFFMNRRVASGGLQVDQKIARVFDIAIQDAELERHQVADISVSGNEYSAEHRVQNVVQSSVEEWATEINRVVKFYVSRNVGKKIEGLYLYGGSSQLKGIDKFFERELGIPTMCLNNCECIQTENGVDMDYQVYLNAIGALIRREEH